MKKFEFQKSYEEIEIAGETHKINFNDEKLKEYQKMFTSFSAETEKLRSNEAKGLTEEEQMKIFEDSQALMRKVTEKMLGENTYDTLYEKSGRSIINMMDLIEYLSTIVAEKLGRLKNDAKNKYAKKSK